MTVEVNAEETRMTEVIAVVPTQEETEKAVEGDEKVKDGDESKPKKVEKCSSYREESNFLSDLKEFEKKALNELKAKLEESILGDNLYKKEGPKKTHEKSVSDEKDAKGGDESEKAGKEEAQNEEERKEDGVDEKENTAQECEEEKPDAGTEECEEEKKPDTSNEEKGFQTDTEISLWGVPLLPSKGAEATDVVLLKFLRAREFKVNDAFEMLKKTLQWRKEARIDSILDEDLCADLSTAAYMNGVDREGHPVCYNIFGVFDSEELYQKTFGSEEKRSQFLRWRCQLMEKGIQKLDLKPGGASSLLQINDLKKSPGPAKKELRISTKQAIGILQDNYPELVAKNIFINVPFWYYALNALISPFLTQRTKSKFVVARPGKVTETLLKYIPMEEIPENYGGFKKENDFEFSGKDGGVASELIMKAGSTETIELPALEVGSTLVWDLSILGWEVNYKEEFVPIDEGSYTIIVQKAKKMSSQEGPIRNSFRTNEPGKVVLTIENTSSKKKRVLHRYKVNKSY
ncbi:patellin-4 [Juglans microcarpa x Juglans regia]|uniref:patellin-4 n=1 Tax=Juglans microcarpa x Juglans regia TaxID=2249226 RepID=UPI001B7F334C|nr:patellin-4 [Juglans microcarpa x Juglans regia]